MSASEPFAPHVSTPVPPSASRPVAAERWQTLVTLLRSRYAELLRVLPHRDLCLVPNPGASEARVAAAEARLGVSLPRSYRAFLLAHDGWPRFFDGAALLGSEALGRASYAELAEAAFMATRTLEPGAAPPWQRVHGSPNRLITFGIDPDGTTLFAFDPTDRDERGEMAVVAWMSELGLRLPTFEALLEEVLDLCVAELDRERALPHLKSA